MRSKLTSEDNGRTFVLILDQGEEAFAAVTAFANGHAINAASVVAIGAIESAEVGWFDPATKCYSPISVAEQCEVLSLLGGT
jgi:predicted DNA-binding protein with PD1-like motif